MGSSKSKNKVARRRSSVKPAMDEAIKSPRSETAGSPASNGTSTIEEKIEVDSVHKDAKKMPHKKQKKVVKKKPASRQETIFNDKIISNLSRALGPNDWIKLAYALGFLPQGIANFMGRASSSQNSYSQCTMMLRTWRGLAPADEILPRLCDALQRIRRHDLAVKVGLELAVPKSAPTRKSDKKMPDLPPELLKLLNEHSDQTDHRYEGSKLIFTDNKVSFLARQILAREEWKRLAYALGFYPDDVAQIIASASSSQNLYAQAHLMLMQWRDKTPQYELARKLRAAFVRIRRHDLVLLLDLGVILAPPEGDKETLKEKIDKMKEEFGTKEDSFGSQLLGKFESLLV